VPDDPRTDEDLMAAYVAGDQAAFRALFDRYASLLYALARRRVASDADARDVVQQTFLQLHRARNDFRPGATLRPWVYTIALNLVRERHRRAGRRKESPLDAEHAAEPAVAPDPGLGEGDHEQKRVRAALARLPDAQREVIELHWLEDRPFQEVARLVGASLSAVKVRAHRGYERLRTILGERDESG